MKWIVYTAVIVNQVTRESVQQVRRAPIFPGTDPALAAERLGGTLLSVQPDVRRAENLRRLTELQAMIAGHPVAEWSPPAEWRRDTPFAFLKPQVAVSRRYRAGRRVVTTSVPPQSPAAANPPAAAPQPAPRRHQQTPPPAVRPIAPANLFRPHPN
jgi:hypothetical protein